MILRLVAGALLTAAALSAPLRADVTIQEVTSPGGLTAWLSEDRGIPFVALEIRMRGGTSLDAPGKRGAVYLMTALIEEGTGDLDSYGFADARDSLGARFSFSASSDAISVSVRMLSQTRDEAAALLARALAEPRFDQDAVDRVREQVLTGLRNDARDPARLASAAFDRLAFGDHPYASSGKGTIESVTDLTRDDIFAAHRASVTRENLYIAAAGDIGAEELGLLIDTILGDLPGTGATPPGPAPWNLAPGISVIDFPSPQSVVYFGHRGIRQEDEDFFAAYILNEVLGGGFSARLMTEVRVRRGLTYGIGSYLVGLDQAEMLVGQFSASNDKVAEALEVIRAEWDRIAAEGITEDELSRAKTYLTGAYPLRFDGSSRIASMLVAMQVQGMPIDYPNTRNARIEAVTMADIRRVAARLFQPEELRFIVAGRPEGVAATP
ncbi:pitrilysin family protein [Rhodobacteraceae bacterium PA1-206B]